jgi:hypothetical protein
MLFTAFTFPGGVGLQIRTNAHSMMFIGTEWSVR